jgi:hypothetical protein
MAHAVRCLGAYEPRWLVIWRVAHLGPEPCGKVALSRGGAARPPPPRHDRCTRNDTTGRLLLACGAAAHGAAWAIGPPSFQAAEIASSNSRTWISKNRCENQAQFIGTAALRPRYLCGPFWSLS